MQNALPRDPPDEMGHPKVDFCGEKRSNEMHDSTTAPDVRRARKGNGKVTKLAFHGHALMEIQNDLIVDVGLTSATGRAEREAAIHTIKVAKTPSSRITFGTDRGDGSAPRIKDTSTMSTSNKSMCSSSPPVGRTCGATSVNVKRWSTRKCGPRYLILSARSTKSNVRPRAICILVVHDDPGRLVAS